MDYKLNNLIIENCILNISLLLNRDKLDLFNQTIKEIDDKHCDKLLIRISGPVSPYSFVKRPEEF